jgi:anaerobic dimethyl sulfoxide reductase subunit B (iron-sulfur subunit)
MTQMGFYFDQTACINCYTCVVACKDWHDVPAGPASLIRVSTIEKGKCPEVSIHPMVNLCYHCGKPACVSTCPMGAITKREEDGIVVVDREMCQGKDNCSLCKDACPYDAPQFGAEENAKMQKCDFCFDRLAEGKKPACVDACLMRALDAGPIEDLRAKNGDIRETEGFVYGDECMPSIVFKPKKDTKRLIVQKVVVAPPTS